MSRIIAKTKHTCKIMKKDIYNKNAREAHLMAEAYENIYKEEFNPRRDAPEHSKGDPHPAQRAAESIIGAEVMFDGEMGRGVVDEVDVENGVAVVVDDDGGEHIVQLGDLDIVKLAEDNEDVKSNIKFSVGSVGGQHGQIMHRGKTFDSLEDACNHAGVDVSECIAGEWDDMGDGTKEYGVDEDTVIVMHIDKAEDNEEAQAYRDMSDRYKAEDSIEVGNVYKGESYHELVIGIKGDEVFTKKITLEDGNRYDKKQMLDEVKLAGKIKHDFLNEIM